MEKSKIKTRTLALIGVLSALVFVLSLIQIRIPISSGNETRIHLGNVMCLLAGVLFGPMVGGLSAGFGSMLFDFTNPQYAPEFWITFIMKFAMGFLAGWMAQRVLKKLPTFWRYLLSAASGSALYIVLYISKTLIIDFFVYGFPSWAAMWGAVGVKGVISALNGIIAVVCCAVFAPGLNAALNASGLMRNLGKIKKT